MTVKEIMNEIQPNFIDIPYYKETHDESGTHEGYRLLNVGEQVRTFFKTNLGCFHVLDVEKVDDFKDLWSRWNNLNKYNIGKLYELYREDYKPLENYDIEEVDNGTERRKKSGDIVDKTINKSKVQQTFENYGETTKYNSEDGTDAYTVSTKEYVYNSNSLVDTSQNTTDGTITKSKNGSVINQGMDDEDKNYLSVTKSFGTGDKQYTETKEFENRTNTKTGIAGIVTRQNLFKQEENIRRRSFVELVCTMFAEDYIY